MDDGIDTNVLLVLAMVFIVSITIGFFLGSSNNETEINDLTIQVNELKNKADSLREQINVDLKDCFTSCEKQKTAFYKQGLLDMDAFYMCWVSSESEEQELVCYNELYQKQELKGIE